MISVFEQLRSRLSDSPFPQLARFCFGDTRGLALFLGTLCYLALLTRVGIFITDTYTTANAFVALTEGHLVIERAVYGPSLNTPGMHVVDGKHYGRNYGQLVLSLPVYWLLRAVGVVADLRIALVAGWSLLVLSFSIIVGRLLDSRREFALGSSVAAFVLFLCNIAVATPIPEKVVPVLAMQLTSILAGALAVVVTYRLVGWLRTPRAGVFAGVLVVLGTPVGFWAPIPKRHVFTSLFVVLALFLFAKSRDPETPRRNVIHGGAYATTGLLAWIHAPEALVLFTTLLVADFATSPPSRYRAAPTVFGLFALSLLPFFLTNYLIAGDPFVPPRLIGAATAVLPSPVLAVPLAMSAALFRPLSLPVFDDAVTAIRYFFELLYGGLETVWYHPEHLYRTFIRSGYIAGGSSEQAINLSVLESAPVLGALAAVPLAAVVRLSRADSIQRSSIERLRQPRVGTGLALGLFAVLFSLLYVERLPLYAQVTVRYLLPLYVVGVIALVWLRPIRRACSANVRPFTWALASSVLFGGQLLAVLVVQLNLALGEAFQFHALLGLVLAVLLALGALVSTVTDRLDTAVVVTLALAAGATVVFSLLTVTAYTEGLGKYPVDGGQLLPIVRVLSEILTAA